MKELKEIMESVLWIALAFLCGLFLGGSVMLSDVKDHAKAHMYPVIDSTGSTQWAPMESSGKSEPSVSDKSK